MKGQYLAVEGVATFGMGLLVAIGTVTAFTAYKEGVVGKAGERQVDAVESRLVEAVYGLRDVDSGYRSVDLPSKIGGRSYQIGFSDGIHVFYAGKEHVTQLEQLSGHEFRGSAEGGAVKVFKRGNQFTLRAD